MDGPGLSSGRSRRAKKGHVGGDNDRGWSNLTFGPLDGGWFEPQAGRRRGTWSDFENIGLRYGPGPEVLCARPRPSAFLPVPRPSGAGKTSLLRLLFSGPWPPPWPAHHPVRPLRHSHARRSRPPCGAASGIVFQDFRLLDHMTTYENVALPLRVIGMAEDSYRKEVTELLDWVGLGERMWALPPVLSGGEKQRAAIARAVIARPQLLLADEPTGNVDPSLAQRLLRLFIELNKTGTAVVIATHDIALMDQYNSRRLVLHEGRLHVYD